MRLIKRLLDIESTAEFIGVICGLGILNYICAVWALKFWSLSNYASAVIVAVGVLLLAAMALLRIPVALILVFGSAAVSAVAFFSGHIGLFLP